MMKTSVTETRNRVVGKIKSAAPALITTSLVVLNQASLFCDNATITALVKVIGFVVLALGAGIAIWGLVQLFPAMAEGDGPAKNKAGMKMISGAIMIVIGALFSTIFGPIIQSAFTYQ